MDSTNTIITILLILLTVGAAAGGVVVFALRSKIRDLAARMPDSGKIDALASRLSQVDDSSRASFERLSGTLGQLSKATEQMLKVGQDISNLEDLLKPPKLRGGMGETLLTELLGQILPGHFKGQNSFKSGDRVDAVIKLGDGLVPVDAKFPLESFRRMIEQKDDALAKKERRQFMSAVKSHIDDIAQKYILPDEGTYDFALMYIPAENVYYETILKDESDNGLLPYSIKKKVIPVSPNSFYAYLQVIIHGLKGLRIEQTAKEILNHLERLKGDEQRFKSEFEVLGTHIKNAGNKYDEAQKRLEKFEEKLLATGEPLKQIESDD